MSTGASSTQYPAAVVAGENTGINSAFQPAPYPNTTAAANAAYTGIGNEIPAGAISNLTSGANTLLGNLGTVWNETQYSGRQALDAGQAQYAALSPYVTQALQAGFDPQNALYNQQFNLQQQQNLASEAMSGVGQSPYAAGLTAQGNQNFNIAWQNNELARQAQAAQTATGLSSTAMGDLTSGINTAGNMLSLGISGQEGLLGAAGNAYSQAEGLQGNQVQQYLAYLAASTNNAYDMTASQLGALNAGTSLYGTSAAANLGSQQLLSQQLGGLGSLAGSLAGAGANYYGDQAIAGALTA